MRRIAIPGVLLGLVGLAPAPVAGAVPFPANVSAANQTLVKGCAWYRYAYEVSPGDNDWLLQVKVVAPSGAAQAFQFFTSGSPGDPTRATARFQLCSANVTPGRYRLEAQLDLSDGSTQTATTLPTTSFTLTKPRPKCGSHRTKPAKSQAKSAKSQSKSGKSHAKHVKKKAKKPRRCTQAR